jgi:thiopeptide-type bacteriocin biosynthesis protein
MWSAAFERVEHALRDAASLADLRLEVGTYDQEPRRSGGDRAMSLTESLFHLDSELAVDALGAASTWHDPPSEFLVHAAIVDRAVKALVGPAAKETVVSHALDRYSIGSRAHARKAAKIESGELHRRSGRDLEAVMGGARLKSGAQVPSTADRWLLDMEALARSAREAVEASGTTTVLDWAISVVHMHCNRAFDNRSVQHERLALELLARQYDRERARGVGQVKRS